MVGLKGNQNLFDRCLTGWLYGSQVCKGIYCNINKISKFDLFDGCLIPVTDISPNEVETAL